MGEFLEIAKVMVQPTMKLLEMCGTAIGTVYEPRHIRKLADAEAYKIKQLGAAITESDNLPITYENGNISMSTVNFEDFAKRAEFREKYQLLREQNNIESIIGKAYQELTDAPEVPSDPVDEDWTTRFFNIAKDISSDDMQHIWGKILAGEVEKPGSFSMRTLETIRNLSRTEAMTFQKILPFVVRASRDYIISSDSSVYGKYGLKFSDFMLLDECGLLVSRSTLSFTTTLKKDIAFIYNDGYCATLDEDNGMNPHISFGTFSLTSAGKELYQILSHEANMQYFLDLVEHIFKKSGNPSINVYKVARIDDGMIQREGVAIREFRRKSGAVQ